MHCKALCFDRQTVCSAAAFENIVQALYSNVVPKPKSECSKTEQLGVSFAAGYLAGILCATISHPADNLVSKLNASKVCTGHHSFLVLSRFSQYTDKNHCQQHLLPTVCCFASMLATRCNLTLEASAMFAAAAMPVPDMIAFDFLKSSQGPPCSFLL